MVRPLLNVSIFWYCAKRVCPTTGCQVLKPYNCMSNPGIRLADCTMLPLENSAGPETETDGGKLVPAFMADTASATRPAHPVDAELEGIPACICTVWSAWEKRLLGSATAGPPVMV